MDIETFEAKIIANPGFLDNLGKSESAIQLEHFLSQQGIFASPLASMLAPLYSPRSVFGVGEKLKELTRKILDIFLGVDRVVVAEEKTWLTVNAYQLFLPNVPGIKGSLEVSNSKESTDNMSIEIAGVGGGSEHRIEIRRAEKIKSEETNYSIQYQIQAHWQHLQLVQKRNRKVMSEFVTLVELNPQLRRSKIIRNPIQRVDPDWGSLEISEEFLRKQNTLESLENTIELSIEKGRKTQFSIGVELEKVPLNTSVKFQVEYKEGIKYSYDLVPGYNYRATKYNQANHWWWETF